jgi:hypothetical protein
MSNSYRIRTTPGVDKSLKVSIDQEFEYLEILSLKVLQEQIYTRQCSDYGVVIGRISVNNGLGLPNSRVSVFIPLTEQDSVNPIISEIYPYKTVTDQNEDGYRYNLLPYVPSYEGHVPTGTFFDREDVIVDPTLIEVYNKYYKYTTVTNQSGDFMIFGVPTGPQTIFVDLDLSDIGEFSLSPNDLIQLGVTTSSQVEGNKFKSSTNLNSLPQIVSFSRNIEVEPLWGEPELCSIGITRTDFDVTKEVNIKISPVSVFIGSIISDIDDNAIKTSCKPSKKTGNQCSLITGPGQIRAIRQTINLDGSGRPALEVYNLENGGQVIDDDGVWVVNIPMNLDYVTTNEFGQQVISSDPSVGVPTKGRYRFKIKWNQTPSLNTPVRRGYYLVPNIREYGWNLNIEYPVNNNDVNRSYSFSTNWNDYGDITTLDGLKMIQSAIDCEDKFYEFGYNKVYTVSNLITQYRNGSNKKRFIGIKYITDSSCESETNKFPINDAQHQPDFLYSLFMIFMITFLPVFLIILTLAHIVKLIACILFPIIAVIFKGLGAMMGFIGEFIPGKTGEKLKKSSKSLYDAADAMVCMCTDFRLHMCLISYPDCENCEKVNEVTEGCQEEDNSTVDSINNNLQSLGNTGVVSKFYDTSNYICGVPNNVYGEILAGDSELSQGLHPNIVGYLFSSSLTLPNRLNLFNTKAKYFNDTVTPGGGVNQIKVTFDVDLNNSGTTYHLDNVICLSVDETFIKQFKVGGLLTFNNPKMSNDPNITGATLNIYSKNSITGTTVGTTTSTTDVNLINRNVEYAAPDNTGNISVPYVFTAFTQDIAYSKYPMDIEYFQVIKIDKISSFIAASSPLLPNSLSSRFIKESSYYLKIDVANCATSDSLSPLSCYSGYSGQNLVFLVRGVDPNTTKRKCSYDLSKLYGYSSFGNANSIVVGDFYLNIPIQGKLRNVKHDSPLILANSYDTDAYSGQKLFYDSFQYQPGNQFSAFTTTMTKYYSSLDETIQPSTPSLSSIIGPSQGLCVSPSNHMTKEWSSVVTTFISGCDYFIPVSNSGVNNRGYFPNEQVEGGSILSLQVNLPVPPLTINPSQTSSLYSKLYGVLNTNFKLGPSGRQIVMRSDRLPSSTALNGENVLHENGNLQVYGVDAGGVVVVYDMSQNTIPAGNYEDFSGDTVGSNVLNTFQCSGMVPLGCYTDNNGTLSVKPVDDKCYNYTVINKPIMTNGCYIFVRIPIVSLFEEISYFFQWYARQTTMYGVCRDVFSFLFTNNWVNGTLYAFPFKNSTFFGEGGKPYSKYCTDTMLFDESNGNFYYRSSPYTYDGLYIGQERPSSSKDGNFRNLMFPTTIMDLGPKQKYLEKVSVTNNFDGYVMNKVKPTTYGDISDLLSLFIVGRLANALNLGGIKAFFSSRVNQFVDGDLAQMLSISSEMGVYPFEPGYYGTNDVYSYSSILGFNSTIGVFYKSDLQVRDFLSPKRTIYSGLGNVSDSYCAMDKFTVFTQEVPLYQWVIKSPSSGLGGQNNTVFGYQDNTWDTQRLKNDGFFAHKYQELDRLESGSRYFRTTNQSQTDNFKGYIYSVDGSNNIKPDASYWEKNVQDKNSVTVGAPYHFYFGLKQGKSAYDKFAESWVDFEDITY